MAQAAVVSNKPVGLALPSKRAAAPRLDLSNLNKASDESSSLDSMSVDSPANASSLKRKSVDEGSSKARISRRSSSDSSRGPVRVAKAGDRANADVEELDEEEEEQQEEGEGTCSKERSREKNKVAAAKCRAKKRENMDVIESSHRTLSAENTYLKRHEQQLRETVAQLRTLALDHQHCNCGVHQYNMVQAGNLARGLGELHMHHFGTACPEGQVEGSNAPNSAEQTTAQDQNNQFYHDLESNAMDMAIDHDALLDFDTPLDPFYYDFTSAPEYNGGC